MSRASVCVVIVLGMGSLCGWANADEIFVDRGACPGEGCVYGEQWVVREPIELHSSPSESSEVVDMLGPRDHVETLTGEVHTRPGRFVVKQARGAFQPGDVLLLYTYLGEGWYRMRHEGALGRADLGFSPWDKRCQSREDRRCWGTLERKLQFWWWVKVRAPSGLEGWVLDSRSFEKPGAH